MKFLHKYQTAAEFNADYNGSAYIKPWVSVTEENKHVNYNKVIFTFHIDISHSSFSGPEDYQAEEGMTWGEWVNSKYNTADWFINNKNEVYHSTIGNVWEEKTVYLHHDGSVTEGVDRVTQTSSMVITPVQYSTNYEGHQGGSND